MKGLIIIITKERAIEVLESRRKMCADVNFEAIVSYNMAIEALKREIEQENNQDNAQE